jgi:hypothetical protein
MDDSISIKCFEKPAFYQAVEKSSDARRPSTGSPFGRLRVTKM